MKKPEEFSPPEEIQVYLGEFNNFSECLCWDKKSNLGIIALDIAIREMENIKISLNEDKTQDNREIKKKPETKDKLEKMPHLLN